MKISIILPTYNRRNKLEKSLTALNNLNCSKEEYEIVAVNDSSQDKTKEFLDQKKQEIPNLKVVHHEENQGIAATRNTGLKHANAEEYVFFTDDDCIVPESWIQKHLQHYQEDPELDAVNGVQWPLNMNYVEAFKIARHYQRYQTQEIVEDIESGFGRTNNLSYKKQVIEEVGEFNPDHIRGSDTEYGQRVIKNNFKCLKDPEIKVQHMKTDTLTEFLKTKYRLGKSVKKLKNQEKVKNQRKTTDTNHITQAWKNYNTNVKTWQKPLFPIIGILSITARKLGEIR